MMKEIVFQNMLELKRKAAPKEFLQMLQVEISSDPNSNSEHLLKLNNDLYLYQKSKK